MSQLESYRPSPERVWIRYRPRNWPAASNVWTDLARATLGHEGRDGARFPEPPVRPVTDVVYLPPVSAELAAAHDEVTRAWARAGTPVLVQRFPGDQAARREGAAEIWDLLPGLLAGELGTLSGLPAGAQAVWPLIPGLTDAPELVARGLDRLAAAAVAVVQPMILELSSVAKRRLMEAGDEAAFDRLFHGPPPSDRGFAAEVVRRELRPFLSRPVPAGNPRLALRRSCAGELRLAAYLSHRLGAPEAESQALLRAARFIDREDRDLAALAEQGNLEIVDWIDERSRVVVESHVQGGRSPLVDDLIARFSTPG